MRRVYATDRHTYSIDTIMLFIVEAGKKAFFESKVLLLYYYINTYFVKSFDAPPPPGGAAVFLLYLKYATQVNYDLHTLLQVWLPVTANASLLSLL